MCLPVFGNTADEYFVLRIRAVKTARVSSAAEGDPDSREPCVCVRAPALLSRCRLAAACEWGRFSVQTDGWDAAQAWGLQ